MICDVYNKLWCTAFRVLFTLFFIGEVIVKLRVFGAREFLWGAEWYWSFFAPWNA